tara:strand:- start:1200 stop:1832 length:633 start_codon:yes stop_codon:yes gene_type:complete
LLIIISYIVVLFIVTLIYKRFSSNNREFLRKIIHIGIGPLIPIAKSLDINQSTALYFAGSISILILINYIYRLFPIIEDIDRKSFGTFFYCLSLSILIYLFWNKDPASLIAGSFIMSFGDGFAGLLGKNIKTKNWKILNQTKSVLGTFTMFLISLIIIYSIGYLNNYELNFYYLGIALLVTILEQFSAVGIDNLIVPIISSVSFHFLTTN